MDIYHQIYQGLGEASSIGLDFTRKAFQMLPGLTAPRILDVGCGQGRATLELARLSGGQVVGLDIDQAALAVLSRRIEEEGLAGHIQVVHGSMFDMDFPDESFDVVWAEGALNAIGFERGLGAWRRFIKPDGFLVVHEGAWLQPNPPQEIVARWQPSFPDIATVPEYVRQLPSCGYRLVGHFFLPEDFWWVNYYALIEARIDELRPQVAGNLADLDILDREQRKVDLYKRHARWYGSAFLVMQRSDRPEAAG
ncbi:MAG: methyltransferase domain-containing protein [Anaerolineae bacterium]|nr:methyltransferase domain-containing protein [Anaerolineae bacterium]